MVTMMIVDDSFNFHSLSLTITSQLFSLNVAHHSNIKYGMKRVEEHSPCNTQNGGQNKKRTWCKNLCFVEVNKRMVKNEANGEGRESRKFLMVGKKITQKKIKDTEHYLEKPKINKFQICHNSSLIAGMRFCVS